jgi:hypothetical protein
MSAAHRELVHDFEIGAHTLHHVDLTRVSDGTAWQEIADSKACRITLALRAYVSVRRSAAMKACTA